MSHGKHVLIVEDETNIMEAIRFVLSREGWRVSTHSDGGTALGVILDRAPDVVILDVMLPDRSGYDILADLKADPVGAAMPVLMLTARGMQSERDIALRLGADRFMTKPFANSEVVAALRELAGDADARSPS